MTPNDIQAAFEARQSAVHQLRELADETRDREMTGDETQTIERINEDIDALDSSIDVGLRNLEREHKATEALETFRSYNDITTPAVENAVDPSTDDQTLFRQLVDGEIRSFTSHASEQRDLTKGSATAGGNLVDSTMFSRIFEKLEEQSMVIAAGATVINTAGGEDLLVPKVTTNPTGALVTEGSSIGEQDPVFGSVTLQAFKFAALTQVSQELLADSSFDVASFVTNVGGAGVTRAMGTEFSNGSGSSRPKGIAQAATSFGTSASATTITAANIFEVWSTMPQPYKNTETAWLMSPEAEKTIRLLVDTTNQYLWQPGLTAGTPSTLLGYPVYVDGNLDAVTSGKRALVFAHMPSFMVRIAGGLQVDRSDDYAFANGLATFRFQMRADSDVIDTNGIGCLTQA